MSPKNHYRELDGLRGIACLAVVFWHYVWSILPLSPQSPLAPLHSALAPFLIGGVDLFFVLSGFLIGGILLDNKKSPMLLRTFWVRRAARILPVYFIVVFSFFALVAALDPAPAWMRDWLAKDPQSIWSYLTFTQNFSMARTGDVTPIWLVVTWSLAVEEQFYLLFPLVVLNVRLRSLVILALACIIASLAIRTAVWVNINPFASYVLLPCRMDALMLGVLTACIVRQEWAMACFRRYLRLVDASIVIFGLAAASHFGEIAFIDFFASGKVSHPLFRPLHITWLAIFWWLIVLRAVLADDGSYGAALRHRLLCNTGLISYGIYMYHEAINGLMHGMILGKNPSVASLPDILVTAASLVTTLVAATASFYLLEWPIRRRAAHWLHYH
jgi:peptidoglycan/LPS O-acetylase OafA/YrhL